MKHKIIVLAVIAGVAVAAAAWYLAPCGFLNHTEPREIAYITVFDGGNGEQYIIDDEESVLHIAEQTASARLKRAGISLGRMGYRFRLTFYDQNGNIAESIILNSSETARKDPFFYYDASESLCVDYIEDIIKE